MGESDYHRILVGLGRSRFRARFRLDHKDLGYLSRSGLKTIENHARDFVARRLAPAHPQKDGKQTPFRGHPVFKAQHATASCCRKCLCQWHGIGQGRELHEREIAGIVGLIMEWIRLQNAKAEALSEMTKT